MHRNFQFYLFFGFSKPCQDSSKPYVVSFSLLFSKPYFIFLQRHVRSLRSRHLHRSRQTLSRLSPLGSVLSRQTPTGRHRPLLQPPSPGTGQTQRRNHFRPHGKHPPRYRRSPQNHHRCLQPNYLGRRTGHRNRANWRQSPLAGTPTESRQRFAKNGGGVRYLRYRHPRSDRSRNPFGSLDRRDRRLTLEARLSIIFYNS